jgi:hypothetical protein
MTPWDRRLQPAERARLTGRPRFLFGMLLLFVLSGCGAGGAAPTAAAPETPAAEAPDDAKVVHFASGSGKRFSDGPERRLLWSVEWERGRVEYADDQRFGGEMEGLRGAITLEGEESSTFRAAQGIASRERGLLALQGGVELVSKTHELTLTCDEIEWDADAQIVKARGNVSIEGAVGSMGPVSELWASPDLKRVATPDLFSSER